VLKPGGHLIAFSGSRTYHRMAVAIEDAGFEIRDQIMWVYGSGFPKSHNIAKQLDKLAGVKGEVIGEKTGKGYSSQQEKNLEHGFREYKAGLPHEHADLNEYALASDEAKQWQGWGTALKPAHEPMVLARKPLIGTVANNVLTYGTGGLNIDGSRVGFGNEEVNLHAVQINNDSMGYNGATNTPPTSTYKENGRFPANFIHDGSDEVVELFPKSKGNGATGGGEGGIWTTGNKQQVSPGFTDSGSAARFFYCAKASKRDRNEGLEGLPVVRRAGLQGADNDNENLDPVSERFRTQPSANHHPTVKPTSLMQYLVRLVTPPNGIVLDPFMGSGSTGIASKNLGFSFIGIEREQEYFDIAKQRI
jgi:site-specific DNA-methyltransferase (adenine-specific)